MRLLIAARRSPTAATAAVCALLYLTGAALYPGFATLQVFLDFFADNASLGIIAVGMTLVIVSGGIDLSVGAVMALCSILIAVLMGDVGLGPGVAIGAAMGLGVIFGLAMGCTVHYLRLAPFIVTLAGMFLARGLALIVNIESMPIRGEFYDMVTAFEVPIAGARLTIPGLALLAITAVGVYLSVYTPFGRNVYALGGSEEASNLMGLPVGRTRVAVYAFSGLCSALAGVVFTFYQSAGNPTAGTGLELDAIAVAVIGGTLLTGGAGSVIGTLIGTLIFGIIQTGIMFQGTLSSWWTKVAVGLLLLVFVLLQRALSRGARASR